MPIYVGVYIPMNKMSGTKTLHNRCPTVRVDIDGKQYRVFSVFAEHPSMCKEEMWTKIKVNDDEVLVDIMTKQLMRDHVCQFLIHEGHQHEKEPPIVAVEMTRA